MGSSVLSLVVVIPFLVIGFEFWGSSEAFVNRPNGHHRKPRGTEYRPVHDTEKDHDSILHKHEVTGTESLQKYKRQGRSEVHSNRPNTPVTNSDEIESGFIPVSKSTYKIIDNSEKGQESLPNHSYTHAQKPTNWKTSVTQLRANIKQLRHRNPSTDVGSLGKGHHGKVRATHTSHKGVSHYKNIGSKNNHVHSKGDNKYYNYPRDTAIRRLRNAFHKLRNLLKKNKFFIGLGKYKSVINKYRNVLTNFTKDVGHIDNALPEHDSGKKAELERNYSSNMVPRMWRRFSETTET